MRNRRDLKRWLAAILLAAALLTVATGVVAAQEGEAAAGVEEETRESLGPLVLIIGLVAVGAVGGLILARETFPHLRESRK